MKLTKIQALAVKQETTQGTAVAATATDFLPIESADININLEVLERDFRRGSLSNLSHIVGKRFVTVKFKTELKGSGVAGTVYTPLAAAIEASSLLQTAPVATNTVVSAPVTAPGSGYTSASVVSFSGGGGSNAAGIPCISVAGGLTGIVITNPGTGYTTPPTPAVSIGAGATFGTVLTGGSYTFGPVSAPFSASYFGPGKSVTIEVHKNGLKHVIAGSLGKWKLMGESGKYITLEFEFKGTYTAIVDASAPTVTLLSQLPVAWMNSNINLHTSSLVIDKWEVDWETTISQRDDVVAATGIRGFVITDRNPKGSCDPEGENVTAGFDFFGKLMASTEAVAGFSIGTTAGNIIHFGFPKVQFTDVNYQDRQGLQTFAVPFAINGNTGDDEMTIVMG